MRDTNGCWVYIVRCADGAFYTGSTRSTVEIRVAEHNNCVYPDSFTSKRTPVTLVFAEHFQAITDAIAMERRIKGWSRAKKEAFIAGDFERLSLLSKRKPTAPVLRDAADAAPQDEGC
ncbi:GIY-YIG nuclease family protein [Bosea sp. FBZP-16]|uniref:GIY-YIG nuclease family protein n=1 Tax=Bosea sp. FBZP-16 TaxID=2065382 RepID=UPI000C30D567|nr:GIY-YIG nuclease family protein [Bosea sp. FBZP-16]